MINKVLISVAALLSLPLLSLAIPPSQHCLKDCATDSSGFSLIRTFEGLRLFPYADAVGIQTVCFGHVIHPGDSITVPMTGPGCETLLENDVKPADKAINEFVKVPLEQHQVDGATDFIFNLGSGTFRKSTLLREINKGNFNAAGEEFLIYNKAMINGSLIPLRGLTYRREMERLLFIQN